MTYPLRDLSGTVVVITGAAARIGAATWGRLDSVVASAGGGDVVIVSSAAGAGAATLGPDHAVGAVVDGAAVLTTRG